MLCRKNYIITKSTIVKKLRKGGKGRRKEERGSYAEGAATRFVARADPTGITGVGLTSHSSGSQRER